MWSADFGLPMKLRVVVAAAERRRGRAPTTPATPSSSAWQSVHAFSNIALPRSRFAASTSVAPVSRVEQLDDVVEIVAGGSSTGFIASSVLAELGLAPVRVAARRREEAARATRDCRGPAPMIGPLRSLLCASWQPLHCCAKIARARAHRRGHEDVGAPVTGTPFSTRELARALRALLGLGVALRELGVARSRRRTTPASARRSPRTAPSDGRRRTAAALARSRDRLAIDQRQRDQRRRRRSPARRARRASRTSPRARAARTASGSTRAGARRTPADGSAGAARSAPCCAIT